MPRLAPSYRIVAAFLGGLLLAGNHCVVQFAVAQEPAPLTFDFFEPGEDELPPAEADPDDPVVREAKVQPQAPLTPQPGLQPPSPAAPQTPLSSSEPTTGESPTPAPTAPSAAATGGLITGGVRGSSVAASTALGGESLYRAATDAGSLLGRSPSVLGVGIQRRTPIVTDTRPRGSRVGSLAASGSYWEPARIDLDTALSKIDSRNLEQITVLKGPYSALYGPGHNFIDFDLLRAPRFEDGFETHGATGIDYKTNGEQWHGKQTVWTGSNNWGARVDYDHRTGNDYTTGAGVGIPSSYNSRQLLTSLGYDPTDDSRIDFHFLRLDQTNVEFPGQAFDMDFLVTDGFEVEYALVDQPRFDRFAAEAWYNRTRFEGTAQNPGKRRQFPVFDLIGLEANTDVDSMSTGFRAAFTWGQPDTPQLTAGVDLRHLKQELNEITSAFIFPLFVQNANSPIPRSDWTNPGLFAEVAIPAGETLTLSAGGRVDWVHTDVIDDPQKLQNLGLAQPQSSLADILGTDEFEQNFSLGLGYLAAEQELHEDLTFRLAAGVGQRAPNLTELYVAQSFLFLLQNGLNIATGDPRLRPETLWQIDLGLTWERDEVRGKITGYHAWIEDYITFENLRTSVDQVDLKYVNTELATRTGVELQGEWDWEPWLTTFGTLEYIEGRDQTRRGDFATQRAFPGNPSERVPGFPRGFFSGIAGSDEEPLPGIPPLESRLGVRLHDPEERPRWSAEISARIVDNQDRVATSLRETPTPGFTVWDLTGHFRATEQWLLVAGVENFTDKNYREHLDFRPLGLGLPVFRPGVNFYFGSELTY